MSKRRDPIEQRRQQIEREIRKLENPKHIKKRNQFASNENFEKWVAKYNDSLRELHDELNIILYPSEYHEVPLAVAAAELGISLSEFHEILSEKLIPLSSTGVSRAAQRISRDEIGRALDIGPDKLLEQARLEIPELFLEAIKALANRDIERAKNIYERIEEHDSCINPFALACEIGILFLEENVSELDSSIEFILKRQYADPLPSIHATREMLSKLHSDSHILECIREQFLAVADGEKATPFEHTFSHYQATKFLSQRSEEQNLAILIGDVVMDSIKRYKFLKSVTSARSHLTEDRETEILRVIQNSVYTALEAYRAYDESPSSKIFVDSYVGMKTTRRQPPELIAFLPKKRS